MEKKPQSPVSALLRRLSAPVEALANLNYLTLHEAVHAGKVLLYAELAEEQIAALRAIMLAEYAAENSD